MVVFLRCGCEPLELQGISDPNHPAGFGRWSLFLDSHRKPLGHRHRRVTISSTGDLKPLTVKDVGGCHTVDHGTRRLTGRPSLEGEAIMVKQGSRQPDASPSE